MRVSYPQAKSLCLHRDWTRSPQKLTYRNSMRQWLLIEVTSDFLKQVVISLVQLSQSNNCRSSLLPSATLQPSSNNFNNRELRQCSTTPTPNKMLTLTWHKQWNSTWSGREMSHYCPHLCRCQWASSLQSFRNSSYSTIIDRKDLCLPLWKEHWNPSCHLPVSNLCRRQLKGWKMRDN